MSTKDNLRPIRREPWPTIRAGAIRQAADVGSIGVHRVDLHVAVANAGEHDPAVWPDRGLCVVPGGRRQSLQTRSVWICAEDVVPGIDGPYVPTFVARPRRTIHRRQVGRGIENRLAVWIEVSASRSPSLADLTAVRPIDVHRVHLVARGRNA